MMPLCPVFGYFVLTLICTIEILFCPNNLPFFALISVNPEPGAVVPHSAPQICQFCKAYNMDPIYV